MLKYGVMNAEVPLPTIHLNEEITPFEGLQVNPPRVINRNFLLRTNIIPPFPISIGVISPTEYQGDLHSKLDIVTPLDPEVGYQIDYRDLYRAEDRIKKTSSLDLLTQNLSLDKMNLATVYGCVQTELSKLLVNSGLVVETTYGNDLYYEFRPFFTTFLERLRFQLFFPRSGWEAQPILDSEMLDTNIGIANFFHYYPIETGPLTVGKGLKNGYGLGLREYYKIAIPYEVEALRLIKAKFTVDNFTNQKRI